MSRQPWLEDAPPAYRGGDRWWLVQAITGILLLVLLAVHLIANHFIVEGGLRTYQDVVAYLSHPFVFVWEIVFLIVVTVHAALGVRSILLDLGPSPRVERIINGVLTLLAAAAISYGIWLSWVIRSQG